MKYHPNTFPTDYFFRKRRRDTFMFVMLDYVDKFFLIINYFNTIQGIFLNYLFSDFQIIFFYFFNLNYH